MAIAAYKSGQMTKTCCVSAILFCHLTHYQEGISLGGEERSLSPQEFSHELRPPKKYVSLDEERRSLSSQGGQMN